MNTFNLDSQDFYVIGAHGCTPQRLDPREENVEYPSNRFFTVPNNFLIVYLTPNGVQSQGSKNIPFIKNLYDSNNELFKYIFNPANYGINLDKSNPESYRHPDFFKSLPFFSNFNYLCNFELYPPGVPCPFIHLTFSRSCSASSSSRCYFEGVTPLNNIITPNSYGEALNFVNNSNIYNPAEHISSSNGFAYTDEIFNIITEQFGITGGVFFVSSCRAEYFTVPNYEDKVLVDILPVPRNCGDIRYDLDYINHLKTQYPQSIGSLDTVKRRLEVRDMLKKQIDEIIKTTYIQNTSYYNIDFAYAFYQYLNILSGNVNLYINFRKITINCNLPNNSNRRNLFMKLVQDKFNEIRTKLINRQEAINECNNLTLYTKLGFILKIVYAYIYTYNDLPSWDIFFDFWNFVKNRFIEDKNQMTMIINEYINPRYNFTIMSGGANKSKLDYKTKYLKYKTKYLNLQKDTIN